MLAAKHGDILRVRRRLSPTEAAPGPTLRVRVRLPALSESPPRKPEGRSGRGWRRGPVTRTLPAGAAPPGDRRARPGTGRLRHCDWHSVAGPGGARGTVDSDLNIPAAMPGSDLSLFARADLRTWHHRFPTDVLSPPRLLPLSCRPRSGGSRCLERNRRLSNGIPSGQLFQPTERAQKGRPTVCRHLILFL